VYIASVFIVKGMGMVQHCLSFHLNYIWHCVTVHVFHYVHLSTKQNV
jgi:hypothetical protein